VYVITIIIYSTRVCDFVCRNYKIDLVIKLEGKTGEVLTVVELEKKN